MIGILNRVTNERRIEMHEINILYNPNIVFIPISKIFSWPLTKVSFLHFIYMYILENDILGDWGLANAEDNPIKTANAAANLWQAQSDEAGGLNLDDVSSNFGKKWY